MLKKMRRNVVLAASLKTWVNKLGGKEKSLHWARSHFLIHFSSCKVKNGWCYISRLINQKTHRQWVLKVETIPSFNHKPSQLQLGIIEGETWQHLIHIWVIRHKLSVCLWVQKLICPIFQASLHNSKGSRGANGGVNEKRRFTYCLRDLLGKQYKSSCSLSHKFPYFLQKSLLMKTWVYQLPCLQLLSMCLHYTLH